MNKEKDELFQQLMEAYLTGTLSAADADELQVLLDENSYYQTLYNSMVKRHAGSAIPEFEAVKRSNFEHLTRTNDFAPKHRRLLRWPKRYGRTVAAALVGFFLAFIYLYMGSNPRDAADDMRLTTVTVPAGGKTKIILPDETVVWLNAASTLTYNSGFNGKLREVHLDGEGFFDVKRDESRPFFVRTDQLMVDVLGTTFNVKAYQDDENVDVTLVTGKVNVTATGQKKMVLAPNEQLVYRKSANQWKKRVTVAERSGAWTSGKLYFENETLTDIMKTLGRKFAVAINVRSDMMAAERFSGSINQELNILEALQYLDVDDKYEWEMQGHTITITDNVNR